MAKMTERELLNYLGSEKKQALGTVTGDLSSQRATALNYYLGNMDTDLPAPEGHSSVVSTDVQDAVEGLMPDLMEIFAGTEEVCRFNAVGPEDEDAAAQETEYVNHVFYQKNDGFLILYSFIKDALLSKTGVVKHWWDEEECEETETYENVPEPAYMLLIAELEAEQANYRANPKKYPPNAKRREIIEHTERVETAVGPNGQPMQMRVHDLTLKYTYKKCRIKAAPVPPEEFLIAPDARNVRDARYVAHRSRKTQSDLIAMGFDAEKVKGLPTYNAVENQVETARRTNTDEQPAIDVEHDPMRLIEIVEHWVKVDWDNDDIAEWRAIVTDADCTTVLRNEDSDSGPEEIFSAMTPIIMTHRFTGRSLADLVLDIQRIKTVLYRQVLDNAYRTNHAIREVADEVVNENTYDDLLNVRPGSLVRTKRVGGVVEHAPAPIIQHLLPAIEFIDTVKENRTGITRYNQGLDADSLNQTATGVNRIMSAAERRMKLIARVFAETGIRDMMLAIHALTLKHQKWSEVVKIRGKWVTVDPRQWKERSDMTVSVGLGTGSKEQKLGFYMNLLGIQTQAVTMQGGVEGPIVKLENVFNTLKKIAEAGGEKTAETFFTQPDPNWQPPPTPPDPKVMQAQAMLQIEQQKAQLSAQTQQAQMQMDAVKAQHQMALEEFKTRAQLGLDVNQLQAELAMRRQEIVLNAALKHHEQKLKAEHGAYTPPVKLGGEPG